MLSARNRPPTGGPSNYPGARSIHGVPLPSAISPLRSVLLDPVANNIPPSKTRTELVDKIKKLGRPSDSYDVDGDGDVSQDDFKLAKKIDKDGIGVLSDEQIKKAKSALLNGFMSEHGSQLSSFYGLPSLAPISEDDPECKNESKTERNIREVNKAYEKMKKLHRSMKSTGSWPLKECMILTDNTLIKHNFYTDKFDQTAWNDFDAIPRSCSTYGLTDHGGSRKRLMFSRRQTAREHYVELMDEARAKLPEIPNHRRVKTISDMSIENGKFTGL